MFVTPEVYLQMGIGRAGTQKGRDHGLATDEHCCENFISFFLPLMRSSNFIQHILMVCLSVLSTARDLGRHQRRLRYGSSLSGICLSSGKDQNITLTSLAGHTKLELSAPWRCVSLELTPAHNRPRGNISLMKRWGGECQAVFLRLPVVKDHF